MIALGSKSYVDWSALWHILGIMTSNEPLYIMQINHLSNAPLVTIQFYGAISSYIAYDEG